jgi:hypothetical protein
MTSKAKSKPKKKITFPKNAKKHKNVVSMLKSTGTNKKLLNAVKTAIKQKQKEDNNKLVKDFASLEEYILGTNKPLMIYKNNIYVWHIHIVERCEIHIFKIVKNTIFDVCKRIYPGDLTFLDIKKRINENLRYAPRYSAIIYQKQIILNGDLHTNIFHYYNNCIPCFTISFNCLSRFFSNNYKSEVKQKELDHLLNIFEENKIKVINYCNEIYTKKKPKNIIGYTFLRNGWHRPATALLEYLPEEYQIIMGQDEGSYFACELPKGSNCKTIEDAFVSLMPEEIRNKKGVKRQGEWFLVPVAKKELPTVQEITLKITNENKLEEVSLLRDFSTSSHHFVHSKIYLIDKNCVLYAYFPTIRHENQEHESVFLRGWAKFLRNTAVRSFSEEGVD